MSLGSYSNNNVLRFNGEQSGNFNIQPFSSGISENISSSNVENIDVTQLSSREKEQILNEMMTLARNKFSLETMEKNTLDRLPILVIFQWTICGSDEFYL